jgi:hypothetical protein
MHYFLRKPLNAVRASPISAWLIRANRKPAGRTEHWQTAMGVIRSIARM